MAIVNYNRTLELAMKAGVPTWNRSAGGGDFLTPDLERFAELLIEECGRATFNYLNEGGSEYHLISNLREHFKL